MGTSTLAINPGLQPNLTPREPQRELAPIGMVFRSAFVLHVHPDVPARSVAEFIAHCRVNPGKVNFGSSGTGAVNHLAQALLASRAGLDVVHVPFRGGAPALIELRAGRIQAMFQAVLEALPVVREGTTRALGISSLGPAGLPAPIRDRLAAALKVATDDGALRARMAEQGVDLETGSASDVAALLARETTLWGELIRTANIRPE
jgi:tripartite-type tricarboxylate transporter receptor subunit TctC